MSRAVSLTRQLLTFSTGGVPVREMVEIESLLKDAVAFALSGSNLVAVVNVDPDVRKAHVDPGQVAQVLHNLLLNARQMMPDGGLVELRGYNMPRDRGEESSEGDWVAIEVKDDGPGMPEDLQSQIFEPFFSARDGGTGLGLAIAHSIISRHGGRISVDSALGHGTCFQLLLPGVDQLSVKSGGSSSVDASRPARVLVMDDEESIRSMLSQMLRHLGHRCVAVEDGVAAVAAYRDAMSQGDSFDVVLLDLVIVGGMGGTETAQRLLKLDPIASLVAASGYSNDAVLGDYANYGFQAAIAKPFGLEELRRVLAMVLDLAHPA